MNFKKIVMSLIFLLLCSVLFSQDGSKEEIITFYKNLQMFDQSDYIIPSQPGEFVVYEDNFAGNRIVLTVFHLGNRRYVIQTFNKRTYEVNKLLMLLSYSNGEFNIEGVSLETGDINSNDLQFGQSELLKMLNGRSKVSVGDFPREVNETERWEEINSTFTSTYKYWVPLFNLYNRKDDNNLGNRLRLIKFGTAKNGEYQKVFDFKGLDTTMDNSPSYAIPPKGDAGVMFDGLKISLDENWSLIENSKTVVLNKNNERYSYITVSTVSKTDFPSGPQQFFSWYLNNSGAYVLPDSVEISNAGSAPTLTFTVFDEVKLTKNKTILMVFDRGEHVTMLTFGAYENFYDQNKAYFDEILF